MLSLDDCLKEYTKEEILDAGNEWYCNVCKEHKKAYKIMTFSYHYLPKILILTLKRFEYRDISSLNEMGAGGGGGGGGMIHREKIDNFIDFPVYGLNLKRYCYERKGTVEGGGGDDHDKGSTGGIVTGETVKRTRKLSADLTHEEQEERQRETIGEKNNSGKKDSSNVMEMDDEEDDDNDAIYDLFAICNHYGRMGFGHYTAYVKDWPLYEEQVALGNAPALSFSSSSSVNTAAASTASVKKGDWYLYDDNSVIKVHEKEIKTSSAYILFYRKRFMN
jgi:ubiquitin carboxyl-terminal hydrolase 4/11/15